MQTDLPRGIGLVVLVALGPVIAHGISHGHAIASEADRRDGPRHLGKGAHAVALEHVPDVEDTVGPDRGEHVPVSRRKGYSVDGVDVGLAFLGGGRLAVGLELQSVEAGKGSVMGTPHLTGGGEIPLILLICNLDRHATVNAADPPAGAVGAE